jgi:hypothetical protein
MSAGSSKYPTTRTFIPRVVCVQTCGLVCAISWSNTQCTSIWLFMYSGFRRGIQQDLFLVGSLGGDLATFVIVLGQTSLQREVGCVWTGGTKGHNEETHKCYS